MGRLPALNFVSNTERKNGGMRACRQFNGLLTLSMIHETTESVGISQRENEEYAKSTNAGSANKCEA